MASIQKTSGAIVAETGQRASEKVLERVERLAEVESDAELDSIRAILSSADGGAARGGHGRSSDGSVKELRTTAAMLDDVLARAGAGVRIRGTVDDVALDVLVRLVEADGMTGRLWIRTTHELLVLDARGGKVYRTRSFGRVVPGELLGDILVDMGFVTKEDVQRVLEREVRPDRPLGVALLASGLVRVDQLKEALRRQSIVRFSRALEARSAAYAFAVTPA